MNLSVEELKLLFKNFELKGMKTTQQPLALDGKAVAELMIERLEENNQKNK